MTVYSPTLVPMETLSTMNEKSFILIEEKIGITPELTFCLFILRKP